MFVVGTQFTESEIDTLSGMVCEDCKDSTFLFVCENGEPDGLLDGNRNCIDEQMFAFWGPSRRGLLENLIKRGELLRFYKGEKISLNESLDDWNEIHYEIRIDNISREELINYLELINYKAVKNSYAEKRQISCYTDKERKLEKYYYVDQNGQKYWGNESIEEPESKTNLIFFISVSLWMVILFVLIFKWIKKN